MRHFIATPGKSTSLFSSVLGHSYKIFTPKRIGLTAAGAFIFTGAVAGINTASSPALVGNTQLRSAANSDASAEAQPEDVTNNIPRAIITPGDKVESTSSEVRVSVNGQDIVVPDNGSTRQTVTNSNGSQTYVEASQGTALNQNTFSMQVNVHSSSQGGDSTQ